MPDLYKYGVAVHLYKPIIKRAVVDFAVSADWTPAAGDVKISKDGGAAANVTNLPTAITMGNTAMWDFSITATEMQAAKVRITVADSATKAVEDTLFEIDTYGNASAQHLIDLADSVRAGLTALPNAAAEAAGGIYTRGSGAGQINQNASGQVDTRWVAGNVTVGTNNDKTGYALSQTFPANFSSLSIDASGRVDLGKWIGVVPAALSATGAYVQAMLMRWNTDNAGGTPNALISGRVDSNAQVVGDKTGYTASTVSDKTGYSLSAGGIQAIWDALMSALTTVGSVGKRIADNLDATVSSRNATTPPTAAAISTQVWTEPIPGAFAAGSAGAKLNSASAAGDPWGTAVPGAYGAGTAGNKLGNLSGASGSGANTVTATVQNDATHPVQGAQFWVTTDVGGTNIIASGTTDTFGKVTVFLGNGVFYGWASKPGENFTNPLTMVVP